MSGLGQWRITRMPDDVANDPDCGTGQIFGSRQTDAVELSWEGHDEMDEASRDGCAELQPDRSLKGAICFHGGDEANFIARQWTSSTAC
jgi:hypothetical protein